MQIRLIRQGLLWGGLVGIFALILLSIYGAFLGAERARIFFNSPAMVAAFFIFGFLFAVGLVFILLRRKDVSLALLHLGPLFILTGGWMGGPYGLSMIEKYTGRDRIDKGTVLLHEGESTDRVFDQNEGQLEGLGFSIRLEEVRVDFYPNTRAIREYSSTLQVERVSGENTGLDGPVRDTIEVNHPLHWGGYHIYQYGYGKDPQEYSVLMITADAGVGLVYTGYVFICAGVLWRCWVVRIAGTSPRRVQDGA